MRVLRHDCSGNENLSRKETTPQDNPNGRSDADTINEAYIVRTDWREKHYTALVISPRGV